MKFTKMHGLGNDYIYVNLFEEKVENPEEVSRFVSDRHFGIGSDGLVLIMPSDKADFRMRMFNSDGSEAEMCGNAIRCVGKYVYENGMTAKDSITVETLAGIKTLQLFIKEGKVEAVRVDMGEPILKPELIPVASSKLDKFIAQPVKAGQHEFKVTCVSMGNPHAIIYMDNIDDLEIEKVGPLMEHNEIFPKRTNTEFVEVIDDKTLKMRVWERGAGETLACGTGACAVLAASVLNGVSQSRAIVMLKGGNLDIEWCEKDNHVYMTGLTVKVFEGTIDI
ncbi:MAG: diaminopimelate epimerase [Eubacteriales bacterium]|nr:diaminopimelate epimerase [Eubacteriales bacterium]